jgi:hypothetical protein
LKFFNRKFEYVRKYVDSPLLVARRGGGGKGDEALGLPPVLADKVMGIPRPVLVAGFAALNAASDAWWRGKASGDGAKLDGWENIDHLLDHVSTPDSIDHAQYVAPLLRDVRQLGIEVAPNAPINFATQRPDLLSVTEALRAQVSDGAANDLAQKLVNGVVARAVGKEALQLSLPVVHVPGLADFTGQSEPMIIRPLVAPTWAFYNLAERPPAVLMQCDHAHKGEARTCDALHWWSRTCNSDREASLLIAPDVGKRQRTQVYAYAAAA